MFRRDSRSAEAGQRGGGEDLLAGLQPAGLGPEVLHTAREVQARSSIIGVILCSYAINQSNIEVFQLDSYGASLGQKVNCTCELNCKKIIGQVQQPA